MSKFDIDSSHFGSPTTFSMKSTLVIDHNLYFPILNYHSLSILCWLPYHLRGMQCLWWGMFFLLYPSPQCLVFCAILYGYTGSWYPICTFFFFYFSFSRKPSGMSSYHVSSQCIILATLSRSLLYSYFDFVHSLTAYNNHSLFSLYILHLSLPVLWSILHLIYFVHPVNITINNIIWFDILSDVSIEWCWLYRDSYLLRNNTFLSTCAVPISFYNIKKKLVIKHLIELLCTNDTNVSKKAGCIQKMTTIDVIHPFWFPP